MVAMLSYENLAVMTLKASHNEMLEEGEENPKMHLFLWRRFTLNA